jgi:hypothetical protein
MGRHPKRNRAGVPILFGPPRAQVEGPMPNSKKYVPGSTCDMTIKQWCERHNYSVATYYNLKKKGNAPETYEPEGIRGPRITAKADANWIKDQPRRSRQAAAKRKAERRVAQTTMAGRLAAKSPLHPANRGHKPPNRTAPSPKRKLQAAE